MFSWKSRGIRIVAFRKDSSRVLGNIGIDLVGIAISSIKFFTIYYLGRHRPRATTHGALMKCRATEALRYVHAMGSSENTALSLL